MNDISSVEMAYERIAASLMGVVDAEWDKVIFRAFVLANTCSSMQVISCLAGQELYARLGMKHGFAVTDAAIFLRDNLLKTTGQRIWGLTFTLYPSGKFNIEYDYNKPEHYEETDEKIDLAEAVKDLSSLGGSKPNS